MTLSVLPPEMIDCIAMYLDNFDWVCFRLAHTHFRVSSQGEIRYRVKYIKTYCQRLPHPSLKQLVSGPFTELQTNNYTISSLISERYNISIINYILLSHNLQDIDNVIVIHKNISNNELNDLQININFYLTEGVRCFVINFMEQCQWPYYSGWYGLNNIIYINAKQIYSCPHTTCIIEPIYSFVRFYLTTEEKKYIFKKYGDTILRMIYSYCSSRSGREYRHYQLNFNPIENEKYILGTPIQPEIEYVYPKIE